MNRFLQLTIIMVLSMPAYAQLTSLSSSPLTAYGSGVNMRVSEMPATLPDLDNSLYLDEEWKTGSILLEDGRIIKECTLRYDIANGYIEIKDGTTVRAAAEKNVQQFTIKNPPQTRWFVSGAIFKSNKEPNYNLMEVLVDGEIKLLLSTKVEIIKPNGGFTDQRRETSGDPITSRKVVKYYLIQNEQLYDVTSKGKLMKAFGEYQAEMKLYAKKTKTGFNKQQDLVILVTRYAELVKNSTDK